MKVIVETSKQAFDQKLKALNLFFEQVLGWESEIREAEGSGFRIQFPSGYSMETPSRFFESFELGSNSNNDQIKVSALSHELISREKLHVFFGDPVLELSETSAKLGWDLLGCVFFMAFRVEEINDQDLDEHERSKLENSLAFQNGFYHYPLVNAYADLLKKIAGISEKDLPLSVRQFEIQPSLDLDHPFKYSGIKGSAKFLRDVLTGSLRKRGNLDPYLNRTVELISQMNELGYAPLVFFLFGPYDQNGGGDLQTRKKLNSEVLNALNGLDYIPGIHIGYHDWEQSQEGIVAEKGILEELLNESVKISRYHYLRFRFPQLIRDLRNAGIDRDHSLGYSQEPGFRAGICHPYLLKDPLGTESEFILESPLILMDRTMINMGTGKEGLVKSILAETKKYEGTFSMLLHNSTFDEPGGMEVNDMFLEICRQAKEEN